MRQAYFDRVSRVVLGAGVVLLLAGARSGLAAPAAKVTLCHVPPGNPANVQLVSVGAPAVGAHMKHGDAVCAAGDSACCVTGGSATCTSLQDDADNCGACGHACAAGQTCTAGTCVTTSACPVIEGTGCYWYDCFDFGGDCCWAESPFEFPSDPFTCQLLDSCNPGGFGLSGGFCYEWADCSNCAPTYPPWP